MAKKEKKPVTFEDIQANMRKLAKSSVPEKTFEQEVLDRLDRIE